MLIKKMCGERDQGPWTMFRSQIYSYARGELSHRAATWGWWEGVDDEVSVGPAG